jgi:hypothetical protein
MSAQAARRAAEVEVPAEREQSFRSIEDLQTAGINVSQTQITSVTSSQVMSY